MERQREREVKKSKVVWIFGSSVQVVEGDIIFFVLFRTFHARYIYTNIQCTTNLQTPSISARRYA